MHKAKVIPNFQIKFLENQNLLKKFILFAFLMFMIKIQVKLLAQELIIF